jgi:hypothetical protein
MQQNSSIDFKLVQRVCLLQQALDQALGSLDELKAQVKDKQWIETQLASTEKYANVQQQAIAHLKQQLSQFVEVQNHLLSVMGYRLNELIDSQQIEFSRVNLQFQQGNAEVQTYLQYVGQHHFSASATGDRTSTQHLALEAEVMIARSMVVNLSKHLGLAQQHLEALTTKLNNHHLNLSQIIKTTQSMVADLEAFEDGAENLEPSHDRTERCFVQTSLESELETVVETARDEDMETEELRDALRREQTRTCELEAVLLEQFQHQTQIRQRYQEVAAERDYYKRELEKARDSVRPTASPPEAPTSEAWVEAKLPLPPARSRRRSQPSPIQPLRLPEEID